MYKKICKLFLYLLGLPKTVYFNFKYLPFKKAACLPIFVSHRVLLRNCGGSITIEAPVQTRMIYIGYGYAGIFDAAHARSIWEVYGDVIFRGKASLGHGSKISVGEKGTLVFMGGGNNC